MGINRSKSLQRLGLRYTKALATGMILSVVMAFSSSASELSDLPLSTKITVLNGRLTIDIPKGTVRESEHRSKTNKEASEIEDPETRASVTSGKQRLDLSVRELYAFGGKDFDVNARKLLEPKLQDGKLKFSLKNKANRNGLRLCQLIAAEPINSKSENQVVDTAIVENKDGTVQYLTISVNSEAAKDWNAASKLAESIVNSVASGTKTLLTKSRKIEIDTFYGLVAKVPDGIATNIHGSADFQVFTFNKMHELGAPAAYLSIYIGQHPAYRPIDPTIGKASTILGQSVKWQEEHAHSLHAVQTLVPLPGTPTVLHIFAVAGSEEEINDLIKIAESLSINEKAPANQPAQKAFLLYVSEKFPDAVSICDTALKSDPSNKDLLRVRADSHIKLKEYKAASEDYSNLIKLESKASGNIINRAKCFYELGDYQKAIEDCTRAIGGKLPGNTPLILRGQANTKLKNFTDAQRDFDKALQLDPKDSNCYIARAQLYRAKGEYKKAINDCTRANSIWENDEALVERALSYEKIGRKDLADTDRTRAAEIKPNSSDRAWPW
ncbi:MAG: tetratricopeptide repeat protein [Cyanobacteria bacterium SZAS TMP-1]|nr:tetratricopeptide repeat protein [Cyanobacteria bacterium SZAS TMP-1]